ncbi:gamma-glutamylcyclotransferase [Anaerobacillus sp. MEB173]|uniref:gamma-glutamylcyclotransferase n=1 Tax=Anaerobacillus sp. MEB173 TaxID=3383345 RepID=UPI003F8F81EF
MEKKCVVFVYGTLRKHEINHHYLQGANCIATQCWTYGKLYDTGYGYPAMVADSSQRVYGELYEVNEQLVKRLDVLEGYVEGRADNLYDRIIETVYTDTEDIRAYVYRYSSSIETELNDDSFSDWKVYRYIQKEELLYFAYGSCMDDERFCQAGVQRYFSKVIGCGVARNFSLAYTLELSDGGRADMVETVTDEWVEGKVYQIGKKALQYLYGREGVDEGVYRPAFIDIEVNGTTFNDVLTFFVIDKMNEVAPPIHYAIEILRGSRNIVSKTYYHKLEIDLLNKFNLKVDSDTK